MNLSINKIILKKTHLPVFMKFKGICTMMKNLRDIYFIIPIDDHDHCAVWAQIVIIYSAPNMSAYIM